MNTKVCGPGDFPFAMAGLDHGHWNGMTQGLRDAGGHPALVYDPDAAKVAAFLKTHPDAKAAPSLEAVLDDPSIRLVGTAAVPSQRARIGLAVLGAGKHFFSDKAPFTSREQMVAARAAVERTGLIWAVYYSERLHNEAALFAGELIGSGTIGRVLNVVGLGPHRLNAPSRPPWFFERESCGGILIDLASHQIEQFLTFADAHDARVTYSAVANHAHPQYPELEDFGELTLLADTGATAYLRVDWFTPDGLRIWGDGRVTVVGTDGFIELRKYTDLTRDAEGDHVFWVDGTGEHYRCVRGTVGYPFFGRLIRDVLDGSRTAMSVDHTFKVAELSIEAQEKAVDLKKTGW